MQLPVTEQTQENIRSSDDKLWAELLPVPTWDCRIDRSDRNRLRLAYGLNRKTETLKKFTKCTQTHFSQQSATCNVDSFHSFSYSKRNSRGFLHIKYIKRNSVSNELNNIQYQILNRKLLIFMEFATNEFLP